MQFYLHVHSIWRFTCTLASLILTLNNLFENHKATIKNNMSIAQNMKWFTKGMGNHNSWFFLFCGSHSVTFASLTRVEDDELKFDVTRRCPWMTHEIRVDIFSLYLDIIQATKGEFKQLPQLASSFIINYGDYWSFAFFFSHLQLCD